MLSAKHWNSCYFGFLIFFFWSTGVYFSYDTLNQTCQWKSQKLEILVFIHIYVFLVLGIKRKKWTSEEERELSNAFGVQIQSKSNRKTADIRNAQKKFKFLSERSEAVIRSKLNNIILGKSKFSLQGKWYDLQHFDALHCQMLWPSSYMFCWI